jgi:hypothetical protein
MPSRLDAGVRRRLVAPQTLLGAALVAWWNADDLADGAVASWADRVGALTPVQATGANQPVRAATSFNGVKPGVTFDGTDDFLSVDATTGLPTAATPGEVWLAMSLVGTNNTRVFSYGGTSTGLRAIGRLTLPNGSVTDGTSATNFTLFIGPLIVGAIFAATIYTARSNGREHPPVYGATLNTSTTRTRIGSNSANTAAAFWNGVVRHVLVTTELTQAQRLALEGWLAWDGGLLSSLPATHPYRWAVA